MERYQPASELNFSTCQRDQSPSWSTPVQVWRVLWCWIKDRCYWLYDGVKSRPGNRRNMCELILKIHSVMVQLMEVQVRAAAAVWRRFACVGVWRLLVAVVLPWWTIDTWMVKRLQERDPSYRTTLLHRSASPRALYFWHLIFHLTADVTFNFIFFTAVTSFSPSSPLLSLVDELLPLWVSILKRTMKLKTIKIDG